MYARCKPESILLFFFSFFFCTIKCVYIDRHILVLLEVDWALNTNALSIDMYLSTIIADLFPYFGVSGSVFTPGYNLAYRPSLQ